MTGKLIKYTASLIIALACALPAGAQSSSVSVSLDSAYVLMGKATPLHVTVVTSASAPGRLVIPADTMCTNVEILKALTADTSDLHNDRIEVKQELLLQSFDSGTYILNPLLYISGNETIASNRPVLKVIPVDVDSLQSINDYADVVDVKRKLGDYLPDFLADYGAWILAALLLIAVGYFLFKRLYRRDNVTEEKKKIVIPPYEKAIQELQSLRTEKLCENGHEREFYTRLTDILRRYLHGRFGINAMEMTSTQIRHILQRNEETRLSKRNMDQVLETADFVKFAKVRPLPEDNMRSFNSAMQFVEDTKPLPPAPAADGDDNASAEQAPATAAQAETTDSKPTNKK